MKDEPSPLRRAIQGSSKSQRPSRRLGLAARTRKKFRSASDRVLATDLFWSLLFVAVVVLILGRPWAGYDVEKLIAGQPAVRTYKALSAFDQVDVAATERRRTEAEAAVAEIYVHDRDLVTSLTSQLSRLFQQGRSAVDAAAADPAAADPVERSLASSIPPAALQALAERQFDAALERELTSALRSVMSRKVVTNKASLERATEITLVSARTGSSARIQSFDEFLDLTEARSEVRSLVGDALHLPRQAQSAIGDVVVSFVDANVYYDREATKQARELASDEVQPLMQRVPEGVLLAAEGEILTEETVRDIRSSARSVRPADYRVIAGLVALASMLAFFLFRYSRYHQRGFRKLQHLHSLLVLMLLSMLVLSKAVLWTARQIADNLDAPFDDLGAYPYLIPLGAGAILVALLANGRIATVYAAFGSLLFGAANVWDAHLMLWAMLVQCAGVYAISTYRERAALLRAGLVVGSVGAAAALALETIQGQLEPLSRSLYSAALGFAGGAVGVGLLISFSLPLLERLFNVLTDIRLLELSNVNNPLLSELAVRAPGSYNHSLVVGTLAEEAARAIGANSLFCRVAAFYHDVGKMNKPEYFVENQRGVNPHDRLTPSMSALIIAAHVKDGIKLAREAGLPEQIVDIIPQHHGTNLMTYFYERAKSTQDPSLGPVKREDFRYPGPKPQTREAAIFMMADGVEAAARTIDDPTPNRLKEMIRKITNSIVVAGELDSCDLTFADLEKIQGAFLRCLVSMYHHRVDYPGFDFSGRSKADSGGETPAPAETRGPKIARSS